MTDRTKLVYEFRAGWFGIFFLVTCCLFAGVPLFMLLTGEIEGTTEHPILGTSFVAVMALAMGFGFGGLTARTVIDRAARIVTDHWSIFGWGPTRSHPLSEFQHVIVRRRMRLTGRVRTQVVLAGGPRQIVLATFYTRKSAWKDGQNVAGFCRLPLIYEDRVPKFWPI